MDLDGNYSAHLRSFALCFDKEMKRHGHSPPRSCIDFFSYNGVAHNFFLCMFALEDGTGEVLSYDDILRKMALFEDGYGHGYASEDFLTRAYFACHTTHASYFESPIFLPWI